MKPHLFVPDPAGHAAHRGLIPCRACPCRDCPLPFGNQIHELPDTSEWQYLIAPIHGCLVPDN